jgi:hypothetical protein
MSTTVIRFQEDDAGIVRFYLEWPPGIANGKKLFTLTSRSQDPEFQFDKSLKIGAAGAKLRDDLLRHEGIKSELSAWLGTADKQYRPIHLELESLAADNLPWEALVDGNGSFLALDKNCPVARVLAAASQERPNKEVVFTPPLRIVCVLGAWWENGGTLEQQEEWASFKNALGTAHAAALQIDVRVFGCDPQLENDVNASSPGVNVNWRPIVGDAADFLAAIRSFRPNMLHVLAHGIADEQPFVAISNVADVDAGQSASILLGAKEIRQEGDPDENIWAISLNSCDTAAIRGQARSLTEQLVRFGFPAVIGMRETVAAQEARLVTQHFYEAVFEALNSLPIGQQRPVEWACFLQRVRLHLAGNTINAEKTKRWLLPMLYARTDPFIIQRGKANLSESQVTRLKAELEVLKEKRDEAMQLPVSPKIKLDMKADFDARIQQIEVQIV